MLRVRTIGAFTIVALLLCAPTAIARTSTTNAAAGIADAGIDSDLARQLEFRRQFGLDTSLQHVQSLQASARSMAWSVPLSADEEQEMARRGRVSDALWPLQNAVEAETGFSGIYID